MDVEDFSRVLHSTFNAANTILSNELLFGLSDEQLGVSFDNVLVDDLLNKDPGYGALYAERDAHWKVMKHILDTPVLFDRFFYMEGTKRCIREQAHRDYLEKIADFKRLLYVLIHMLSGMPKRGTEEYRHKIANVRNRMRNVCFMYGRVGILGLYSKTSGATGQDKVSLQFLPSSIGRITRRFYALLGNIEEWMVGQVILKPDPQWQAYLYVGLGKRFKSPELSDTLKFYMQKYGGLVGLGLQNLRHILPAISEEYGIGEDSKPRFSSSTSIMSNQMGHNVDIHGRLYAQTKDDDLPSTHHSQLTSKFCWHALQFSLSLHQFWGFDSNVPSIENARKFRASHATTALGSKETLANEFASLKLELRSTKSELQGVKSLVSGLQAELLDARASLAGIANIQAAVECSDAKLDRLMSFLMPINQTAPFSDISSTLDTHRSNSWNVRKGKARDLGNINIQLQKPLQEHIYGTGTSYAPLQYLARNSPDVFGTPRGDTSSGHKVSWDVPQPFVEPYVETEDQEIELSERNHQALTPSMLDAALVHQISGSKQAHQHMGVDRSPDKKRQRTIVNLPFQSIKPNH